MSDLFASDTPATMPLAARLRPTDLAHYVGQTHLVGEGRVLANAIKHQHLHSMILWGPSGTGKTTLAKILAAAVDAEIAILSAVTAGVKDIRATVEQAQFMQQQGKKTVLFVDEIHRFSKSQQDAFLPFIEDGTFILIGATTENPSFELNQALLSRVRVHVLKPLETDDLMQVLQQALQDKQQGLGNIPIEFPIEQQHQLTEAAQGDARRLLNWLETLVDMASDTDGKRHISIDNMRDVLGQAMPRYDKGGEAFYDIISALHKSVCAAPTGCRFILAMPHAGWRL